MTLFRASSNCCTASDSDLWRFGQGMSRALVHAISRQVLMALECEDEWQ